MTYEEIAKQLKRIADSLEFEGIKKSVRDLFHFNTGNCFKTEQEAEEFHALAFHLLQRFNRLESEK